MSLFTVNTLVVAVANNSTVSTDIASSSALGINTVVVLTVLCVALILWLAWRYKAGSWIWLCSIGLALLAVLLLPVNKKNAAHIYVLTKEKPLLHERLFRHGQAEADGNAMLKIASVPIDASLLGGKDNKDEVVLDLRDKSPEEQLQALRPYMEVKSWTVMGNGFPANNVLKFPPSHLPIRSEHQSHPSLTAVDESKQVPAIHWQSSHKYSESLEYPRIIPVHSLWTLRWKILSHQTGEMAPVDGANLALQLMDGNEQLLSQGTLTHTGEVHLSHRFSAQGRYNFQLRFLLNDQETQRLPVSVFVTQSHELDARLDFASPSFEWRALKRWLERSHIPYQSQVKTAKEFNRKDQFGTRIHDSTPLLLFDERSWLVQSKAELQARTQQIDNGAIVIIVTDVSDSAPNEFQASANAQLPSEESWRKQEFRLFGAMAERLRFSPISQPWKIESAKLGQGGVIFVREKEWHRVGTSDPERYDQVMAEVIGGLWRTSSPSLSDESELLAPGYLSRLCVDNALPSVLNIEYRNTVDTVPINAKHSMPFELIPSARAGQYCVNKVFDRSGWFAIYVDYSSNPDSGNASRLMKLGEIFIPEKSSKDLEHSRHLAALSFYESDSERAQPSRFKLSSPTWRAWAFLGLLVLLTTLWWRDQKKSISGDYRRTE